MPIPCSLDKLGFGTVPYSWPRVAAEKLIIILSAGLEGVSDGQGGAGASREENCKINRKEYVREQLSIQTEFGNKDPASTIPLPSHNICNEELRLNLMSEHGCSGVNSCFLTFSCN